MRQVFYEDQVVTEITLAETLLSVTALPFNINTFVSSIQNFQQKKTWNQKDKSR
jgi:hypothetical protein